jgi:hypothetical protein
MDLSLSHACRRTGYAAEGGIERSSYLNRKIDPPEQPPLWTSWGKQVPTPSAASEFPATQTHHQRCIPAVIVPNREIHALGVGLNNEAFAFSRAVVAGDDGAAGGVAEADGGPEPDGAALGAAAGTGTPGLALGLKGGIAWMNMLTRPFFAFGSGFAVAEADAGMPSDGFFAGATTPFLAATAPPLTAGLAVVGGA